MKKYWGIYEVELEFKIEYLNLGKREIVGPDNEGVRHVVKIGSGNTPTEGWHYIKTKDGLEHYDKIRDVKFTPTPSYTALQQEYLDRAVISLMAGKADTLGVVPQEELIDQAYEIAHTMLLKRQQ